jgi:hypothetical protein
MIFSIFRIYPPSPKTGSPDFSWHVVLLRVVAACLEFKHPTSGEAMKFEAPLPPDMQNLLDMLRKYRKT